MSSPSGDPREQLERDRVREAARQRLFAATPRPVAIGRYLLRGRLGEGATGVVYEASDPQLERSVAIKILAPKPDGSAPLAEARALARLNHPYVLAVYDVGQWEGSVFIVTELAPGGTLRTLLQRRPPREVIVDALLATGEALAAGHAIGLAHCDVKADNVLIGADGRPRLCDFGLAVHGARRDAEPGAALPGTLRVMAPEQLAGQRADARSDQFSFAQLAFEALTGRAPFTGTTHAERLESIRRGPALPATDRATRRLLRVLARGLEADPEARYPSMRALLGALTAARRPRPVWLAALALGALVLGGVGVLAATQRSGTTPTSSERARPAPRAARSAAPTTIATEAEISREAMELTKQGRWGDCARHLATRATTDALRLTWLSCAEASGDAALLEAACADWSSAPRAARGEKTPQLCDPALVLARSRARAGDARGCAEGLLAAPPTDLGYIQLSRCAAQLRDPALYQRACEYGQSLKPPEQRSGTCGRVVDVR